MIPCDICGKEGHAWFNCPKRSSKPANWKPARLLPAARGSDLMPQGVKPKAIVVVAHDDLARDLPAASLAKISEVQQKRGRGRPPSIDDMKAYKAAKQREYRARIKAEKAGTP